EYKRVKVLFAQSQNASARALESAEAAMKRDRALLDAARARLLTGWGKALADREDLPAMVKALTALESALVRIDLPPNESLSSPPTGAHLGSLSNDNLSAEADFLDPAPTTDAQMQGKGFLFLLRTNSPELRPDTAVTGFLKIRGELLQGVAVPRSAVVRHEQRAWVYVQTDKDTSARKPIVLNHPTDDAWFITEGLSANARIVVSGVQALLSEELKSQIRLAE
ncbi:MAG: efflux RND transporter periplasmic adaptor subunit, partial [Gammaproteobacteria bacterium]